MSVAVEERLYTPEDLLTLPDVKGVELVGGRLVEKEMGAESSWIGGSIFARLYSFNEKHGLGWVMPPDAGYQCFDELPRHVRRPDASYISSAKVGATLPVGHIKVAPDLAVEVVSPNEGYSEVAEKVVEYRGAGVRLIWIVDPRTRTATVHRSNGSQANVREDDFLEGEDVLPGFRCRLGDILPARRTKEEEV